MRNFISRIYVLLGFVVCNHPLVIGFRHPILTVIEQSTHGMVNVILQSYSSIITRFERSIPIKLDFLAIIRVLDAVSYNAQTLKRNTIQYGM